MAEKNNPLAERVKKMALILEAARKAGEEAEKAKEKEGQAGTGQPDQES